MIKRTFDIIVSFFGIILLGIPFILLVLLIKLTSKGPVFFCQKRVGRNAKLFRIIKFRTMEVDTEKLGTITTATDTRITPIGRVLRRYKLDELPQLWNVFIGRMSFVGPRPDVSGYADKLKGKERRVLGLRPGITGPASIYFKNEEELLATAENPKEYNDTVIWPKKVELNLEYIDNWSFRKDIGYIVVTLFPGLNKVLGIIEETEELNR